MSNQIGNFEAVILKEKHFTNANNIKVKLKFLGNPPAVFEMETRETISERHLVRFSNIPLGHYEMETMCDGYTKNRDLVHVKFSGGDSHWKRHFIKSKNNQRLKLRQQPEYANTLAPFSTGAASDKIDITVKGVGAGWAWSELTLQGRTALKLSGENFYVTGRPQPGMWVPNTGSTTSFFIYKATNPKKVFRLDYHSLENIGGKPAWHYNITKGYANIIGLQVVNHAVTPSATSLGRTLTIFRWSGKALFVVGAGLTAFDLYYAENKSREVTRQVGGWTGAIIGGKYGAKGDAKLGAAIAAVCGQAGPQIAAPEEIGTVPIGVIAGTVLGGIGGGIVGWIAGSKTTETTFDWLFQHLEKEKWVIY